MENEGPLRPLSVECQYKLHTTQLLMNPEARSRCKKV